MHSEASVATYEMETLAEDIVLSASELSGALDDGDKDDVAYRMAMIDKAIAKIDTIRANLFLQLITGDHINMEEYLKAQYAEESDDDCCSNEDA